MHHEFSEGMADLEKLFGIAQSPEDDFTFFQHRRMPGTCQWVLQEPALKRWMDETLEPCITWLSAPPASGKTILSTYVIEHTQKLGLVCEYFYFRVGDQLRRSVSALLRSIGVQLAMHNANFKNISIKLSQEGIRLEKADARIIWQKLFVSVLSQVIFTKPIYWIIDALDESDLPRHFLDMLQDLAKNRLPIHVFIISRNTDPLSLAFEKLSDSIPVDKIVWSNQYRGSTDIELYVDQEINHVSGSNDLKEQIKRKVLHSANGNFLWVHLVLEEIASCHSQQAIQQTLEEIPPGMEALYRRMEQAVVGNSRQADRNLARTLIFWTICAQRPLSLIELSQALSPDFPEFLDLRRTIELVCGQFIVVDQTSHVSLVHQSARDYLTKTSSSFLSVNLKECHKALFIKTIIYISSINVRSKIERGRDLIRDTDPFLIYAATSWSYHLRHMTLGSKDALTVLVNFLEGPPVLSWIHSLALFRQLGLLVNASQSLSWFASLTRKLNAEKSPLLHQLQDLETIESWTTDLLKIVGKFGRHLLQKPTAIYKEVPPFCPTDSITYRQFSHNKSSDISVSGISNTIWDDCLARITLSNGAKAWKISCAGRYFAVASSAGSIFLGNSFDLEEICTLSHEEFITAMCFNSQCDRFASYGVKTTKIWAIPQGKLLTSVANPRDAKAMAITFTKNDTEIFAASDDKLVRSLNTSKFDVGWQDQEPSLLRDTTYVEGGYITSPCYMAFSPDATQIAVAYRGYPLSVWSTSERRLVGRCKRASEHRPDHGRPSVPWMAVDRVVWNPITSHLIGLYKDGSVFKWHPVGDETQEAHTTADEVEVSPDGKLFITSDSNGAVKIWNFAYFSVIYQLSSEDLVTGLAFSPDSRRFYDLRGSSINVWEPNTLVRLADTEEATSETASDSQTLASMSQGSEAWIGTIDPICALKAAPQSSIYCSANDDGAVQLFDTFKGKLFEFLRPPGSLAIQQLSWGEDGKHLITVDLSGTISGEYLDPSSFDGDPSQCRAQSIFSAKPNAEFGGIHQVLLKKDPTRLLVLGRRMGQIWSMEKGHIECTRAVNGDDAWTCINHPLQRDLFLGITPKAVTVFRWEDFSEVSCFQFRGVAPHLHRDRDQGHLIVSVAMLTQDETHVLIQIVEDSPQATKITMVLKTALLGHLPSDNVLDILCVPNVIASRVEVPLGVLPQGRLVFLDRDLWMCTFTLDSTHTTALKRHFFIPRDWVSTDALAKCCLLDDGTFLLPKDGKVAIIASNLGAPDW